MRIMRLNFSHATYEEATLRITNLRKAQGAHNSAFGSNFNLRAILLDIQGPKIRTGSFVDGAIEMQQGKEYELTTDEVRQKKGKGREKGRRLADRPGMLVMGPIKDTPKRHGAY